jgi:hypothetical protein
MGRPPIGKHALSGAERQRRYMAKLLAGKPSVTKSAQPDGIKDREIATLKARIAELERRGGTSHQLTRSHRRQAGEIDFSEVGKLQAEIRKLKSDIFKLKATLQEEPDAAKLRKKVVDQQTEMAGLRRVLKQTAKERDQYKVRVAHMQPRKYGEARGLLTRQNYGILIKALHSDRMKQCSAADLAAAERLAAALRPLFDEYDQ